jgi:hypothetical protein
MRDKKDNATIDLPGFEPAEPTEASAVQLVEPKRGGPRPRRVSLKQEQLALLDLAGTDDTGLPAWKRDPNLDLTGLPVWQPDN